MKIQFDADLPYQGEAIRSVCDLFEGQEVCSTLFTVAGDSDLPLFQAQQELGIGNRLKLLDDEILDNVKKVQLRNGLAPSTSLETLDFTVEMETGTGKTYVYLRSIFEMNRRYGFTKFIIVVPSLAIKEGVYKSLQITEAHFKGLFDNVRYDYFIYDSQKLGDVRNFATSDCIQIMVINIDAFRRSFEDPRKEDKANIIHRPNDRMTGSRPIDFIQATNPIVIIDEPQSVDTTAKSQTAITSLNPLCTIRYSATHRDKLCQVYRLDAVDAYEQRLVKQIEVAGLEVEGAHNRAYVKLVSVDNRKTPISASLEIDVAAGHSGKVKRSRKKVHGGTDLFELSGGREVYEGYIVDDIYCASGNEYISFTSKPDFVRLGEAIGDVNDDDFKRLQIRRTIQEHLDKELYLRPQGIKVLSLFFVDKVANYRDYDKDGNAQPGKYALMFEEEYARLIRQPKYADLFGGVDIDTAADGVHNGYFAIDKKKDATGQERLKDSRGEGKAAADEGAYQLIMRDKERLLSFDSKLKFIFSHTALREGWDNPNVFQICTLNETSSLIKKRQEIGRGLRIAVNQDGERVHGFAVNTLTVMANESYDSFARQLQREIEDETGIRFGVVEKHLFANLAVTLDDGTDAHFGVDASNQLWQHLRDQGYIDDQGRVQDSLRRDLKDGTVDLPADLAIDAESVQAMLKKVAGSLHVLDADAKTRINLNKRVYLSPEFQALWDRIKYKTTFCVKFDPEQLIRACADEIASTVVVGKTRFVASKSTVDITRGGVIAEEVDGSSRVHTYDETDVVLPDIVTFLQNETNLTRRSIVEILRRCKKLDHFKKNPQRFIEQVTAIIQQRMRLALVDGIKYERIGDDFFYAQELFEEQELHGYLSKNMLAAKKSVYDHVIYDSDVEAQFAEAFEKSADVNVYAKLPGWFKIDTPLGTYNPDWAVLVEREDQERLYFVMESKGSLLTGDLRIHEQAKIDCGKVHFEAIGTDVRFAKAHNYSALQDLLG
ncbi:MAG: DEAD/DEAH box helicase family protein [Planctomycetales bacterium]|nr:DEAD/DEAH box helicase family protein [Planctomycetales bacterium]